MSDAKKSKYQKLEEKLSVQKKSCLEEWDEGEKKLAWKFAEKYKEVLGGFKTEREWVKLGVRECEKEGWKNLSEMKKVKAGDKIFAVQKEKSLMMMKVGKAGLKKGMRMVMSHIDSPHLDLKVNPLFEDEGLAWMKTHYYGGIKKYQWPTIQLALHGVVVLENGKKVEVEIGEKDDEPVFMITDLLPHLDRDGGPGSPAKKRVVMGEHLNLLVGSVPVKDEKVKEKVKLQILEWLNEKWGMKERDFVSAEIQAVPAGKARDLGFDRSMISGFGHDDRVCAWAGWEALKKVKENEMAQVLIWVDREEIGNDGVSGIQGMWMEKMVSEILEKMGEKGGVSEVLKIWGKSEGLSADVTAAVDPDYKDVHDLRNAARLGWGIAVERFTGSGGKFYTSEAGAEFMGEVRRVFGQEKKLKVQWGGGLGKVDAGGGGTVAKYMANRGMEIVDVGVPVFNMHAPLEIVSKADLWCAVLAFGVWFEG